VVDSTLQVGKVGFAKRNKRRFSAL